MMRKHRLSALALWPVAGLCALAAAGPARAAWPPTGTSIPDHFDMGSLLATQTRPTGFGDNLSELNQMFAWTDGFGLAIGLTGNIENNGNGVVILLDTRDGGTNVINYTGADGSGRIYELNGDTMDADFAPDYALDLNNSGGTLYVDLYDLQANTKTFLGQAMDGAGLGTLTGGGAVGFTNNNTAGVTDAAAVDASGFPLAASATSGVELIIPRSLVAATGDSARLMAVLIGGGGFVSSQVLPGLPDTYGNLGNGPTNYQAIPGAQNARFGLTPTDGSLPPESVVWTYTPVFLSGDGNVDAHPPVTSTPTVFNGHAYLAEDVVDGAGNHTANIVAVDATSVGTAHLVPAFGTNGRVTGLDGPVVGRIAVYYAAGVPRLYAATTKGTLYMMDAGTGANLRSAAVFPGGTSVSTPAVTSMPPSPPGIPAAILAGKMADGSVHLARVLDLPVPFVTPSLLLVGATDVTSSPSVIADGSRVQIGTTNGAGGAVYTVDAATFTVFNMALTAGPVTAAPTLTTDPAGIFVVGDTSGPLGNIYAFNASNAAPVWQIPGTGSAPHSAFMDYRAHPNMAYVQTDAYLFRLDAAFGAPAGTPGTGYPRPSGSPLLLKPSVHGPEGSVYLPTVSGLFTANALNLPSGAAARYPLSARVTTPSATGPTGDDLLVVTGDNGAGPTGTAGPTGFTGGNAYGLASWPNPS